MKDRIETTIHFIRPGEVYNPSEIVFGRLPRYRLTREGKQQARAVAEYMSDWPIAAVFHSPMLRARQTARYIAAPHDLKLQETSLLDEIYTPYEGHPLDEVRDMEWDIYNDIPSEYETPEDIVQRVRRFCERVQRNYARREVVAVTHRDVIVHTQLWARGLELTYENRKHLEQLPAKGSISTIIISDDFDNPDFEYREPDFLTSSHHLDR